MLKKVEKSFGGKKKSRTFAAQTNQMIMEQIEKLLRNASAIELVFDATANTSGPTVEKKEDGTVVFRIETTTEELTAAFKKAALTKLKERDRK